MFPLSCRHEHNLNLFILVVNSPTPTTETSTLKVASFYCINGTFTSVKWYSTDTTPPAENCVQTTLRPGALSMALEFSNLCLVPEVNAAAPLTAWIAVLIASIALLDDH